MNFIQILESISDFLIHLPKDTSKTINIYKKQLSLAKGDKFKISMAENTLLYFFLKNWLIKTLAPLAGIILAILLIVKYYILILAFAFICYLLWSHFSDKHQSNKIRQQQEVHAIYHEVTQFIFKPLRELDTWLNVKQPQGMTDIFNHPSYNIQNGIEKLLYKLLKKSPEPIEVDKIDFSEKMLQSLITSQLYEKQTLENQSFFFKDLPCLVVDHITDFGDYIQIQIVLVNQESSYNYVKQKAFARQSSHIKIQSFDEDF
ncbi:hypothetical protein AC739_15195 [Planococcus glaciei]|uniref:hypothetical protein n=1 Tax=Planococcus glaciei TaxID=459472 RepID=UPI00069F3D67|nr:hypothetical protein [Planococcus glaciei]KOF09465.1 hypothetical protein AC739_15195 [Planococcus glaciei]